jgi:UDP-3-O-[3-hydroxymyristoyl] glucosamine N-acyltransferase
MVDDRFYESLGPIRLADLAEITRSRLLDPSEGDVEIVGVASLDDGGPGRIGFLESEKKLALLEGSRLEACFIREADARSAPKSSARLVVTASPDIAFATASRALIRARIEEFGDMGVHPSVSLGEGATIASGARVAQDVRIGARTRIGPNAVIGCGVWIGEDGDIGPGAVVRFATLGARVRVHANAVIGESGYGLAHGREVLVERFHMGRVAIADDVRIGAGTTVDRGMFVDTTIGEGTKIDNLVQIAHNVRIGRRCVIAGCTGVSGSVVIEDDALLGGSVGVSDHVTIGAGARLAGATLVMRDVPAGEAWSGAPARPIRQFFRELVALEKLSRRSGGGQP